MDILKLIQSRRSIRRFTTRAIPLRTIKKILDAGRWAPSGLNNQPWRFMVLSAKEKNSLAGYTKYSHVIKSADKVILVFLNKKVSYNYEKDLLAVGACIQNMLLSICSMGLGACWLGEILNQREGVSKMLKVSKALQLEAIIAVGVPVSCPKAGRRKKLDVLMAQRFVP